MELERFYKRRASKILQAAAVAGIGLGGSYIVHQARGDNEPNSAIVRLSEAQSHPANAEAYDNSSNLIINGGFEDALPITLTGENGKEIEIPAGWIDYEKSLKHFGIAKNMGINGSNALFIEVYEADESTEKSPMVMHAEAIPIEETTDYVFNYKIKNVSDEPMATNAPSLAAVLLLIFLDENKKTLDIISITDTPDNTKDWFTPEITTIGPNSRSKIPRGTKSIGFALGVTPVVNARQSYLGDKILIDRVYFGETKSDNPLTKTPAERT